ncbi:MAG: hypothetical protein CTY11_11720 [Methylomonas sp.]|nr:MAG: hypothetical protein CTY11_11720 [Methylomonas sp.]
MGLLAVLSSLSAPSPRHAWLEVSTFVGLGYLAVFIATCVLRYRDGFFHAVVATLAVGAGLYMTGFFSGYVASFIEGIPLVWPEPFYMLSNVRQFNQYQLWTLGLLMLPVLPGCGLEAAYRRWFSLFLSAWWVLLFASGSRGVLLAWLLALAMTAVVYQTLARPLLWAQIKHGVFGLAGYCLLFIGLPRLNNGGGAVIQTALRNQTEDRLYLWGHAWAMIKTHPWLGVGPMHFAWYPNDTGAHPHNSVLQLAAELGLPAIILVLLLTGHGLICWLQRYNARTLADESAFKIAVVITLFFTLVMTAAYSLVDGVIVMPLSQVMMALMVGLAMGVYRQQVPATETQKPGAAMRLLAGATLAALVWAVLPDLLPRITGNERFCPVAYQVEGPRFWQEGGIPQQ